jgi:heme-degrading monooxygenase HmoA
VATLIELFDVPPGAHEEFLTAWRSDRPGATLHRALRHDAAVRFVSVGPAPAPRTGSAPTLYEIAHEDGAVDEPGGVIVIEPFEVPEEADDRFLAAWHDRREAFATLRGYLGTRLHRSVGPADFRFIAIARWSSPLMVHRARQRPEVQEAAVPFRSHPAFYQRI